LKGRDIVSVDTLLSDIDEILENAKTVPFSGKVMVDADQISTIIEEVRFNMPEEFTKARKIATERRDILNDAQNTADEIIGKAEQIAKGMIEKHEITAGARKAAEEIVQQARAEASELLETTRREANSIMEQAHKWSTDIRESAGEYVEDIIKTSDDALTQSVNEIRRARQQLRVAASKKTEQKPDLG
jgi:cell division septum initiation protein DivIVA